MRFARLGSEVWGLGFTCHLCRSSYCPNRSRFRRFDVDDPMARSSGFAARPQVISHRTLRRALRLRLENFFSRDQNARFWTFLKPVHVSQDLG